MTRHDLLERARALLAAPADGAIPRRRLGKTGETVTAIGIGGFHVGLQETEAESIRIVRTAIDEGITFLDNCWDYMDGESERRMGKALRGGYRARAFLMTKVDGRDRRTAERQLDDSLRRLRTDHIDLLQLHEVIHPDDPERAFASDGAMAALLAAKEAGKARFLGFTGHKSADLFLRFLRAVQAAGFPLDTVQLPLNVLDGHDDDGFERKVLPVLVERDLGVLGMKPFAEGKLLRAGAASAEDALRYAMSLPVSVTITGCDSVPIVHQALRIARGFEPLDEARIEAILERSRARGAEPQHEGYKSTTEYDGTTQNPSWLGRRAAAAVAQRSA